MEAGETRGDETGEDRGAVGAGGSGCFAPEGAADHAARGTGLKCNLDLREERFEIAAFRQQRSRHGNQCVHLLTGVEPDSVVGFKGWIDRERQLQQMRVGCGELAGGFDDDTARWDAGAV